MKKEQFNLLLAKGSNKWENRELLVTTVLANQELMTQLLENMKRVNEKNSAYAARILELVVKKDNKLILPFLDEFTSLLKELKFDGSVRASAKLIEILCVHYFVKLNPIFIERLTDNTLELFTEVCFDWMITDRATAIQAHSMYALYLLGDKFDWIHSELVLIINRNLPNKSIGYQNRGKKIINAIKTDLFFKL